MWSFNDDLIEYIDGLNLISFRYTSFKSKTRCTIKKIFDIRTGLNATWAGWPDSTRVHFLSLGWFFSKGLIKINLMLIWVDPQSCFLTHESWLMSSIFELKFWAQLESLGSIFTWEEAQPTWVDSEPASPNSVQLLWITTYYWYNHFLWNIQTFQKN